MLAFVVLNLILVNCSFALITEKVGVLILAHGGRHSSWDETVNNATEALKRSYLVEVAFGMANPKSMQAGIDKLESQGATKIVVVPLFISSYSPIIRQNEYLLGLRESLADPPLLMPGMGADNSTAGMAMGASSEMSMQPLRFKAEIILTKPLDAHPLVAEILHERIAELSANPANETILIVAHGPNKEEDNRNWVKTMEKLTDQIREKQQRKGARFKQIFALTVRDDADTAVYEQAKEHLRTLVYQAGKDGDVIVIPLLLAQGGVEARYVKRLTGLAYKWSGKTLLPHPNITRFIQVSVENALQQQAGD